MTKLLSITSMAAAAAIALASAPAAAQVGPSNGNATATARIIRPLTLTHVQDLDLGTILLSGAGAWTGAVVSIDRNGVFSCTDANVTCSGTRQVATYNVTGTNNQVITISAPDVTLTEPISGDTLLMTVDSPGTVTLTNSGAPGDNFSLGGSITVDSTTTDGVYSGTFDVTVDYS